MVCLLSDVDTIYWPTDRKEPLVVPKADLEVTLQSQKSEDGFTERICTVMNKKSNTSRVIIHLQFAGGPSSYNFVPLANVCLSYHRQQRDMTHPVLVHCLTGSGKTATFILVTSGMAEINLGNRDAVMPDLVGMAASVCQQRKGVLRERDHFKHALQGLVKHGKNILVDKGLIAKEPEAKKETVNVNNDLGDLSQMSNQLGLKAPTPTPPPPTGTNIGQQVPVVHDLDKTPKVPSGIFSSDLSKLADLTLDSGTMGVSPNRGKKITKQDFTNPGSGLKQTQSKEPDPSDPLSSLDPLWSMK